MKEKSVKSSFSDVNIITLFMHFKTCTPGMGMFNECLDSKYSLPTFLVSAASAKSWKNQNVIRFRSHSNCGIFSLK